MSTHPQPPVNPLRPAHPARPGSAAPAPGFGSLGELIAAAAAPAADALPGEQQAMAAFRAAHRDPAQQPRRKPMIQLALAKLLTVKAAAVAAGLTLTGGIAVAAGTGAIPNPLPGKQPAATTPAHSTPAPTPPASGSPAAALFGLCTAYLSSTDNGILDTPAFAPLVQAAEGKDNVTAYCTQVTANPPNSTAPTGPHGTTPPVPTMPPGPGAQPTATPTPSHPTGAPTPTPARAAPTSTPEKPRG